MKRVCDHIVTEVTGKALLMNAINTNSQIIALATVVVNDGMKHERLVRELKRIEKNSRKIHEEILNEALDNE